MMQNKKHRFSIKWTVAAIVTMAVAVMGTKNAFADNDRAWRVSDIKGSVSISENAGSWTSLKRGDRVGPGTAVKTGPNGRVIMVRPGDSIDVAPNSHFNIPIKAPTGSTNPATHIAQKMGNILFKITTRPDNPFTVKTPYLAAVIKGTTFTVSVDGNNAALHVSKGAVQVSSILGGQTALVRPGQTAAVSASGGGRMRLMGMKSQSAPANKATKKDQKVEATSSNKSANNSPSQSKGGRNAAARSVIPQAIGQKRLNIKQVSRGLVTDTSANASSRRQNGKGKKGLKSVSGASKSLGTTSYPQSAQITYGHKGNNTFGGNGNGNSGSAPGNSGSAPGNSGNAPGKNK